MRPRRPSSSRWGTRVTDMKKKLYKTALRGSKRKFADPGDYRKGQRRTKPEKDMMSILRTLGLEYEEEFSIPFANTFRVYDFRVGEKLLIEVDGDYIHYNNETQKGPRTAMHLKNKQNDKIKQWLCEKRGYTLIRFWASTIENDKEFLSD